MDDLSQGFKQRVVRNELKRLEEEKYISTDTYSKIVDAHMAYYESLKKAKLEQVKVEQKQKEQVPEKEYVPKPVSIHKEPEPKQLSPQEIRDRNITWLLNLGVVLLLFGGLILSTSTWEILTDWMKAGLIGLVSLLFFSLAFITTKLLKIERTGFAFLVLGSLFLPIVILSAGHFELFGTYFSIYGEGMYLYGALGSFVLLPLYFIFATRLNSRLFIWFTYITLSTFASFLIGSFKFPVDGFYLAIMLFNAGLIAGFYYFRNHELLQQFTKEFSLYIQANLILSTLFMLIFFNSELIYSFNLFLTAVLYLSMIYVSKQQEYHFVFSALLIYAAYQLIEFSLLSEISVIAYALIGFVFLAMPKFLTNEKSLQTAFRYTSAFVSGAAFLYITVEGVFLKLNDPSILLLIAYLIISINFIFLVNIVKQKIFAYLSSVFIMTALFEGVLLGQLWFGYESITLPTFFSAVILYLGLGCYSNFNIVKRIKESARDVSLVVMVGLIMIDFTLIHWLDLAIMLLAFSVVMVFMDKFERRALFVNSEIAPLFHSVFLALAVNFFYLEWNGGDSFLLPIGVKSSVAASLIVLVAYVIWKYVKSTLFSYHAFFVSQAFYALSILNSFGLSTESITRVLIMFGGIGMAYLLYRKTKWEISPYLVSGTVLLFYLTGLHAIHTYMDLTANLFLSLQFIGGAILLLGLGIYIGKWDQLLRNSSMQIAHVYLPVALLVGFVFYGNVSVWAFLVATVIYGVSAFKGTHEALVKGFLYAGFTTFWLFVNLFISYYELNISFSYTFFITSIVIATMWYVSKGEWTRRMAYYLVPFSLLGMMNFIGQAPNTILLLVTMLVFGLIVLLVLHQEKWDWLSIIPLAISYLAIFIFGAIGPFGIYVSYVLKAGFGIILIIVGTILYKSLFKSQKDTFPLVDWYSVVGIGSLFSLYLYNDEAIWMSVLPGLLISVFLFTQRKRVSAIPANLIVFASIVYLIEPYYAVLSYLSIPRLIEYEVYLLPWVFFSILFTKFRGNIKDETIHYIQWVVLGITAALLLQKAILSSSVYDALLLGVLSLLSLLGGMRYQLKSFFFMGSGVLLLNVFLQTGPFWNAIPLWVYILGAGSILIGVASYNEYHKQKVAEGKSTLASNLKEKIMRQFREWK